MEQIESVTTVCAAGINYTLSGNSQAELGMREEGEGERRGEEEKKRE